MQSLASKPLILIIYLMRIAVNRIFPNSYFCRTTRPIYGYNASTFYRSDEFKCDVEDLEQGVLIECYRAYSQWCLVDANASRSYFSSWTYLCFIHRSLTVQNKASKGCKKQHGIVKRYKSTFRYSSRGKPYIAYLTRSNNIANHNMKWKIFFSTGRWSNKVHKNCIRYKLYCHENNSFRHPSSNL